MNRILLYLVVYFFSMACLALDSIHATSDLNFVKQLLCNTDRNTLVIFDVDQVLVMPTEEYSLSRNPYRHELWLNLKHASTKEQIKKYYGINRAKSKWRLVDPQIIPIYKDLERRKIATIALTSIETGAYGVIKSIEDWRIQQLKSFGFDFSKLSPLKDLTLPELEQDDGIPMLKSGIIMTAHVDKGIVLEKVLVARKCRPRRIIFIDDQLSNLESVAKAAKRLHIDFYGIHYTAVNKLPASNIDKRLEDLRFHILQTEGKWLNSEELKSYINQNRSSCLF